MQAENGQLSPFGRIKSKAECGIFRGSLCPSSFVFSIANSTGVGVYSSSLAISFQYFNRSVLFQLYTLCQSQAIGGDTVGRSQSRFRESCSLLGHTYVVESELRTSNLTGDLPQTAVLTDRWPHCYLGNHEIF